MELKQITEQYDVDYTKNTINQSQISEIENAISVKIGPKLKSYILEYGYLGYEFVELYGVYSNLLLKSDMVTQTQYIHKYFEKTKEYIALENPGEGDYIIVDSSDNVCEYNSETDKLIDLKKDLFEYIFNRFAEV